VGEAGGCPARLGHVGHSGIDDASCAFPDARAPKGDRPRIPDRDGAEIRLAGRLLADDLGELVEGVGDDLVVVVIASPRRTRELMHRMGHAGLGV
jgi:hypothetical protein